MLTGHNINAVIEMCNLHDPFQVLKTLMAVATHLSPELKDNFVSCISSKIALGRCPQNYGRAYTVHMNIAFQYC